jgi:hypothetical protein
MPVSWDAGIGALACGRLYVSGLRFGLFFGLGIAGDFML